MALVVDLAANTANQTVTTVNGTDTVTSCSVTFTLPTQQTVLAGWNISYHAVTLNQNGALSAILRVDSGSWVDAPHCFHRNASANANNVRPFEDLAAGAHTIDLGITQDYADGVVLEGGDSSFFGALAVTPVCRLWVQYDDGN